MSNNGQDKSGNVFKYSLIPLTLGVVLIFFLHRSCDSAVFEPTPAKNVPTAIIEEELSPEQPIIKNIPVAETETTVEETSAVANDSVQVAE